LITIFFFSHKEKISKRERGGEKMKKSVKRASRVQNEHASRHDHEEEDEDEDEVVEHAIRTPNRAFLSAITNRRVDPDNKNADTYAELRRKVDDALDDSQLKYYMHANDDPEIYRLSSFNTLQNARDGRAIFNMIYQLTRCLPSWLMATIHVIVHAHALGYDRVAFVREFLEESYPFDTLQIGHPAPVHKTHHRPEFDAHFEPLIQTGILLPKDQCHQLGEVGIRLSDAMDDCVCYKLCTWEQLVAIQHKLEEQRVLMVEQMQTSYEVVRENRTINEAVRRKKRRTRRIAKEKSKNLK